MKTLLGLILFSVLLAPGASLKCATCMAVGDSCTGTPKWCGHGEDACVSIWMRVTTQGIPVDTITKKCIAKSACADLKSGIEKVVQQMGGVDAVVRKVECSKAPAATSGSLLLALSGLLLLKLLS
ncbi:UNVERIFIED_CONTAM: hypothetical protein K2H54_038597 [Gekko kuhli]